MASLDAEVEARGMVMAHRLQQGDADESSKRDALWNLW